MTNGGNSGVQLLAQFFRELAENHELYNSYLTDPLQTMRDYGISEDLIAKVLQGDLRGLNRKFLEEFADSGGVTFLFGTIVVG
jgi:hypothetical protein